ncbi:MAG: hypothetical protein Q4B13_10310 [Lautropia sp.]|nr:hypothetical protein [Lautropia sp.]
MSPGNVISAQALLSGGFCFESASDTLPINAEAAIMAAAVALHAHHLAQT